MKRYAIIVAGGTGSRMKADVPKQFMLLGNKPVLQYSIEKFYACNAEVVVVLNETLIDQWKKLCIQFDIKTPHNITNGGATRSESVFNGLKKMVLTSSLKGAATDDETIVAIHDSARPFVSVQLIDKLFTEAATFGNAVPCINVNESLRKINADGNQIANRDEFVLIQTPQCFNFDKIYSAYVNSNALNFTDDASLYELMGNKINLVAGEKTNFKITVADDLKIGNALIKD